MILVVRPVTKYTSDRSDLPVTRVHICPLAVSPRQLNSGHSHVEVSYGRIHADLGNPVLVEGVVQAAVGVIGPYLFDVIKPSTLDRVNRYLAQHCQPHVKSVTTASRTSSQ